MPLSWKSVWDDFAMSYSAAKPDGERQHVKTGKCAMRLCIVIVSQALSLQQIRWSTNTPTLCNSLVFGGK